MYILDNLQGCAPPDESIRLCIDPRRPQPILTTVYNLTFLHTASPSRCLFPNVSSFADKIEIQFATWFPF